MSSCSALYIDISSMIKCNNGQVALLLHDDAERAPARLDGLVALAVPLTRALHTDATVGCGAGSCAIVPARAQHRPPRSVAGRRFGTNAAPPQAGAVGAAAAVMWRRHPLEGRGDSLPATPPRAPPAAPWCATHARHLDDPASCRHELDTVPRTDVGFVYYFISFGYFFRKKNGKNTDLSKSSGW